MVIRSAYDTERVNDTLLIDHQGEFVWNPDTVIPGFYFLEKGPHNHLVLIFTGQNTVQIDAQYINFPNNAKVSGSNHAEDFSKVEAIRNNWHQALQKATTATSDSGWIPTPGAVHQLKEQLDSVTNFYRQVILDAAKPPLVRMYALLQTAGRHTLFDPWENRQLFYTTDSLLASYQFMEEVGRFSEKVSQLKATEQLSNKLRPGDAFPEMILSIDQADTITVSQLSASPVYIGIYNPSDPGENALHEESLTQLVRLQSRGFQVAFLLTDSATIAQKHPRFHYHNYRTGLPGNIQEELGIVRQPANFILNESGIIVAKNVWGNKLQQIAEQLLQK
ncbi:hypothetical protein JCM15548_1474 [Geofilum rubicundum JCM 15548]|uniref:Thioredoxin domain-containing protein n=2 Tax=Geofilum TaxID=1236988 RepID=A0A0E9LSY1_9BACT|nr:hypothetical protein JCM15548_1474 [Geofilum rubicundum JCM 15548]